MEGLLKLNFRSARNEASSKRQHLPVRGISASARSHAPRCYFFASVLTLPERAHGCTNFDLKDSPQCPKCAAQIPPLTPSSSALLLRRQGQSASLACCALQILKQHLQVNKVSLREPVHSDAARVTSCFTFYMKRA